MAGSLHTVRCWLFALDAFSKCQGRKLVFLSTGHTFCASLLAVAAGTRPAYRFQVLSHQQGNVAGLRALFASWFGFVLVPSTFLGFHLFLLLARHSIL